MILVIGPAFSGKKEYVKTLGYTEADMSADVFSNKKVVYGLEKVVFENPENSLLLSEALLKKEVVVCCEVGSGIIPISKNDRISREAVGRLTTRLAQNAEKVVRLQCGIPMILKEKQ